MSGANEKTHGKASKRRGARRSRHDPIVRKEAKSRRRKSNRDDRQGGKPADHKGSAENRWPVYDSLQACAADSGWPISILKQAKSAGCPAFRASRIYFGELARWWFPKFLNDPNTDWGREFKRTQTLRERIRLAEDEHRVIDFAVVSAFLNRLMQIVFSDIERVFGNELPPIAQGLDAVSIQKKCIEEVERLKTKLRGNLEDWQAQGETPA